MISVATADTSASVATNTTTATTSTFPTFSTAPCSNGSPSSTFSNRKKNKLSSVFRGKEGPAENFKISEWAPDAVDEMLNLKVLREQISPYGGTIGDLFDKTPKGNAVKIMLEDKVKSHFHFVFLWSLEILQYCMLNYMSFLSLFLTTRHHEKTPIPKNSPSKHGTTSAPSWSATPVTS